MAFGRIFAAHSFRSFSTVSVKRPGHRVGAIPQLNFAIAAAASAYASADYNREYVIDLPQLHAFVQATQEPLVAAFNLDEDGPVRQKFLARLQGEFPPSAASLTFCAAASSMVRTISTSSMARLRRVIERPPRVSLRTGSAGNHHRAYVTGLVVMPS